MSVTITGHLENDVCMVVRENGPISPGRLLGGYGQLSPSLGKDGPLS